MMKAEILNIHLGECGAKIGLPYWEIMHYELENAPDYNFTPHFR